MLTKNQKIIGVGLNYIDHARETKKELPSFPVLFARYSSSIVVGDQDIILSECSSKFDYEGELAVIIGKKAKNIKEQDAFDYIEGYAIFNDVTARDYQNKSSQWLLGKNFDNSGAIGSSISKISKEDIMKGLSIKTFLNGKIMQDSSTNQMIFNIAKLIEVITKVITLEPYDIIVTGTPAGVGYVLSPPVYLQHNDIIEIEIEKIGRLKNRCIKMQSTI
jgi:2-keto-4-pentenoate hydratase/2-oxohepta-3-ene-1,7-dioic acid hydratase in catechol pathway